MCGIFGVLSKNKINKKDFKKLALLSRERGKDSSGFLILNKHYYIKKYARDVKETINKLIPLIDNFAMGHSRLITNSTQDNQPILREEICCIHNGIIVNFKELFSKFQLNQKFEIDTEILPVLINYFLKKNYSLDKSINEILAICKGIINCAVVIPKLGKMLLFSNNGSLYLGLKKGDYYFASEEFILKKVNCHHIKQVFYEIIDLPISKEKIVYQQEKNEVKREEFVPTLIRDSKLEELLIDENHQLQRCSKCILPSTMPFIKFDHDGVCNYCNNYEFKNYVKYDKSQINDIFNKYKNKYKKNDCIIPLSGGRDSCLALHLAKKEFNLNPITYTYDWGLVTDLARRNISRICSKLNVENIIFADNISKKRNYIKKNVSAWLKKPHLGMVNLFTAGDKHFFRHIKTVKKRTGLKLDLWGINPYEITHFKSGFLGLPPDFESKKVYVSGLKKQFHYHFLRLSEIFQNYSYLNLSIFDNLYGEIYRSIVKKKDHYSIFDFYKWNEEECGEILKLYEWEKSVDTNSTWRIGDGAAAFYNYIYKTMAGFSEHDTFRSNQIREGDITREDALELVKIESKPRYQNIKWFLDIINLDYIQVINRINSKKLNL